MSEHQDGLKVKSSAVSKKPPTTSTKAPPLFLAPRSGMQFWGTAFGVVLALSVANGLPPLANPFCKPLARTVRKLGAWYRQMDLEEVFANSYAIPPRSGRRAKPSELQRSQIGTWQPETWQDSAIFLRLGIGLYSPDFGARDVLKLQISVLCRGRMRPEQKRRLVSFSRVGGFKGSRIKNASVPSQEQEQCTYFAHTADVRLSKWVYLSFWRFTPFDRVHLFLVLRRLFLWYRGGLSFSIEISLWHRDSAFCCSASWSSSSWDQPVRVLGALTSCTLEKIEKSRYRKKTSQYQLKLGGRFGPEKKYLASPPPKIPQFHPPGPSAPPLLETPPLVGLSTKNRPPPTPGASDPSPSPSRKK